jgi:hypothetical protein
MNRSFAIASFVAAIAAGAALAQDARPNLETRIRSDKSNVERSGRWIYDDLSHGVEEAKKSGKPLLVIFRCIPCEACAKLDEEVVTSDRLIRDLLDQFVCVRIPHANGMDLSLFQFDYDQSWAAFFLEPDMTILGRYGTRSSQKDSTNDVSLEGFAKSLEGALALHAGFPEVKSALRAKRGEPLEEKTPEDFPSFGGKFGASLDYAKGKDVVPTCIHCHQLSAAERRFYRDAGKPIPDRLLYPYPNPKSLGIVMDPKSAARILRVEPGSPAKRDGLRAGDEIRELAGQPILSTADIQWVLHHAPASGSLAIVVVHPGDAGKETGEFDPDQKLSLPFGWRSADDISWRASSWDLRRMTTGGMLLEALPAEERAKLGIKDGAMALVAKHVGQYGEHAAAKNAGFLKGDVVVSVDGCTDVMTETQWMTWLVNAKKPGEKVPVTVLRDGKKIDLSLPMQ